jgi:hypothetical protein
MNELVPWVMCLLFGLIADATAPTTGNTNPCGVVNGTPLRRPFQYEKFLERREPNSLWIGH